MIMRWVPRHNPLHLYVQHGDIHKQTMDWGILVLVCGGMGEELWNAAVARGNGLG